MARAGIVTENEAHHDSFLDFLDAIDFGWSDFNLVVIAVDFADCVVDDVQLSSRTQSDFR